MQGSWTRRGRVLGRGLGRGLLCLLSLGLCTSCVTPDSEFVNAWVRDLNARQVASCIFVEGHGSAYVHVRVISATGGTTLDTCLQSR